MARNAFADRFIGDRLARARIARRISQRSLATELALAREALSAIEHGRQSLTVAQLVIVLRVLGQPDPDVILGGVPDATPTPTCRA